MATEKERIDPVNLRNDINAMCRGSIVLLSGHVEGYIRELGELALDSMHAKGVPRTGVEARFFYHISKNYLDEVQDTSEPDKIARKIFDFVQNDISYWSKNGPFPAPIPADRFNKGFSNPAFDKIRSYFNRFGYATYKKDLLRELRANGQPTINMVDHMVNLRNNIAHGDPLATKTPSDTRAMRDVIKRYCRATDKVFASWWKDNFCAIR
jgi:hypothetical protein